MKCWPTFGEPAGVQWVDVKLGGKVRYIAPPAARTKKEAGYAGFTIYFDRGRVWDWELIVMNPSTSIGCSPRRETIRCWGCCVPVARRRRVSRVAARTVGAERTKGVARCLRCRRDSTEELPPDFQFITRETTLQTVSDKAGPHSRLTKLSVRAGSDQQAASVPAFEYELPDHGAVIIMPEHPFQPDSCVRAVVYRRPVRQSNF
jgi:hypothetical protein